MPRAQPELVSLEAEEGRSVALEDVVPTPAVDVPAPAIAVEGLRTARVVGIGGAGGRRARIVLRGRPEELAAEIAPEVDPSVIADAVENGDSVLVELCAGAAPLVVAALHTRRPRAIRLKASTVTIEGDDEVLIKSGRGALRVRADGDIEVVGSRISAASRGLFRIVGRMLRLN